MPSPPTLWLRAAAPQHFSCSPQVVTSVQPHQPSVRLYLHYLSANSHNSVPFFNPALVTVHSGSIPSALRMLWRVRRGRDFPCLFLGWLSAHFPFRFRGLQGFLGICELKCSLQRGRWSHVEHQSRWADLSRGVSPHNWTFKINCHNFKILIYKTS